MSALADLKKAKQYSDSRNYDEKHQLVHQLVKNAPEEFFIDSEKNGIVGLTHQSTGFKIHVPKNVVSGLNLATAPKVATAKMTAGEGMPNTAFKKLPSLSGIAKGKITKSTMSPNNKPQPANPFPAPTNTVANLFPATTEYMLEQRLQPKPYSYKAAALTVGGISKALGYSPGFWYDEGVHSPAGRTQAGNVITGLGLAGAGLLSIPLLQYLFPERFEGKGKALAAASILGGMATPWILNTPSTLATINRWMSPNNDQYTDRDWRSVQRRERALSRITPMGANMAIAEGRDPNAPVKPTFEEQLEDPTSRFNAGSDFVPSNSPGAPFTLNNRYYVGGRTNEDGEYVGGVETDSTHNRALNPAEQPRVDSIRKLRESMASGIKQNAYIPMDLEIARTHLANVTAEQMRSGYVDYGQAAGLMLRAGEQSNKPWVTVRDIADAAIGAGAGAIAGTIAAKGIGMFMNLSPTERKVMQGSGAALGTLINLGKLGI